jgi:hypothetical protein
MFRVDINVMAGRSGVGTISLVEFLASTQEVCGGRACVAFGLMNSREFEEASEAIEVPK